MSLNNLRPDVAYGLSSATINTPPQPIVAARAPTAQDKAPIGQEWVVPSANQVYFLTSIINNIATWLLVETSGGAGVFNSVTSATFVNAGTSMSAGTTITAGTGITSTTGNIAASSGNISASGTVTGGTGLIATTGNITASATTAIISAPGASASITTGGTITAQGGITSNIGNITATLGTVIAEELRATADTGGAALATTVTNAGNLSPLNPAGTLTIEGTNGANGVNTGFIKIYVGATAQYIPYFSAPLVS